MSNNVNSILINLFSNYFEWDAALQMMYSTMRQTEYSPGCSERYS